VDEDTLIANLDRDPAEEPSAVFQRVTPAAKATVSCRRQLEASSLAEVVEMRGKVRSFANRIVALGDEPVIERAVAPNAGSNREMPEGVPVEKCPVLTDSGWQLPGAGELGDEGRADRIEKTARDVALRTRARGRVLRDRPLWPGASTGEGERAGSAVRSVGSEGIQS
jgi:hypothetical protein